MRRDASGFLFDQNEVAAVRNDVKCAADVLNGTEAQKYVEGRFC